MKEFNVAKQAIKQAGQKVLRIYTSDDFSITLKAKKEPVTTADLASEKIILNSLKQFDYGILSEETDQENDRLNQQKVWIIDPLDGTKDFINRTGDFTIMIGLVEMSQPIMGLVYQPVTDTLYFAIKGQGSYKQVGESDPVKLQVSSLNDLSQARLLISRMHTGELERKFAEQAGVSFVKSGSAGLKICKIADNQADIYIISTDKTREWDICSGQIILTEAGGRLTDLLGQPIVYNSPESQNQRGVLSTNSFFHQKVLGEIKEHL